MFKFISYRFKLKGLFKGNKRYGPCRQVVVLYRWPLKQVSPYLNSIWQRFQRLGAEFFYVGLGVVIIRQTKTFLAPRSYGSHFHYQVTLSARTYLSHPTYHCRLAVLFTATSSNANANGHVCLAYRRDTEHTSHAIRGTVVRYNIHQM